MIKSPAGVAILGVVGLIASACASNRSPVYVAPSSETIEARTEMSYGGDGQQVVIANHSSVPIMITGLRLVDCENIKNRCDVQRLRVRVEPTQRVSLTTVRPDNTRRPYSFRFTYTWERARDHSASDAAPTVAAVRVAGMDTTQAPTRDAFRRANEAAATVDTILVHPDSVILRVGEMIQPWTAISIEARDAAGARVGSFAPLMRVEDQSIVEQGPTGLTARQVGRTQLVISPISLDSTVRVRAIRAVVVLRVIP